MSGRVRSTSLLSLGFILILTFCICGLAVHFIAEGLAPSISTSSLDLPAQAVHVDDSHGHSEDHFIFPHLTHPPLEHSSFHRLFPVSSCAFSFPIPPQLPPPDY